jgi:single-strand DNA-binding protein
MYQKLIIIGNLGRDPEMKFTPDGNPVTTINIATSRKYKDKDETTWFRVSVFGKQAESVNQFLVKGSKVLVEGRLWPDSNGSPRVYQKKDGTWGASYDVTADTVRFLSPKGETSGSSSDVDEAGDDDIPF